MSSVIKLPTKGDKIVSILSERNLKIMKELRDNLLLFVDSYKNRRERFHPYVYPFYLIIMAKVHMINKSLKEYSENKKV